MTVLSYTNAFPAIPVPNHKSGQSHPQSYIYPGAVQPNVPGPTPPAVLSYTTAFPRISFPQHKSGQTNTVQSYLFQGGVQPLYDTMSIVSAFTLMPQIVT